VPSRVLHWQQGAGGPVGRGRLSPPPAAVHKGEIVEHLKLGVHIWVSVLIMGTLWRIVSYHLIASPNESLVHLGRAMAQQY
jgi:hypothetical protein